MKIKKNLCKATLLIFLILICSTTVCYASNLPSIGLFKPETQLGSSSRTIISMALGALRGVGIILICIAIALIGFNIIIGSASEKAEGKGKIIGLMIAGTLLTGGTWVAKMIVSLAETL